MAKLANRMFGNYLQLNVSGHFVRQPHHFMSRVKPMDYLLIWVLAGQGFAETEGVRIEAQPGQLLTFLPGPVHTYGSDHKQPWDILWAHFQGRLAGEFMRAIRSSGAPFLELGLDNELRDRWTELVIAQSAQTPETTIRCNTGLYGLLGLIIQRLRQRNRATTITDRLNPQHVQAFIHNHFTNKLTLSQLAHAANLSVPHYTRLFKKQFGVSPLYYVIQKRIALASVLLMETNSPLKQIALSVGYEDPFYFSRLFKKVTGVSPQQYRRKRNFIHSPAPYSRA